MPVNEINNTNKKHILKIFFGVLFVAFFFSILFANFVLPKKNIAVKDSQAATTQSYPITQDDIIKSEYNVGAYFFYWYGCPTSFCDKNTIQNIPPDINNYTATSLDWYKREFKDMVKTGLNTVIPVSWGSRHPSLTQFHDTNAVPLMVKALQDENIPLKISYLDDTNSVVAEWNMDNGRAYSNPSENPNMPKMPLNDSKNWKYFYDLKMKPYYSMIPQNLWATNNGKSVEEGGRPLVMIYDGARSFLNLESSADMFANIKAQFKRDFKDSKGNGIEPFLVLDESWFTYNSQASKLTGVADAEFAWLGANETVAKTYIFNNYKVSDIYPGAYCAGVVGCDQTLRNRNYDPVTKVTGDEGTRLRNTFRREVETGQKSNLVAVETWNELYESTSISRITNYKNSAGTANISETYYMDLMRSLIIENNNIIHPSAISGTVEKADCIYITGWAADSGMVINGSLTDPIQYHVYIDGDSSTGKNILTAYTDQNRVDVNNYLSTTFHIAANGKFGFNFLTPSILKDGKTHTVYIYGVSIAKQKVALLGTGPKTIACTSNTSTPIPATNTIVPTTIVSTCVCQSNNMCSNSCTFASGNSNAGLSCATEIGTPTLEDKNNYCTREFRSKGDADGDGKINSIDYIYYVRAVNGGTIPTNINPDFNGDGHISVSDRAIVVQNIQR